MRRSYVLVALAVTTLVALAFVIPLALLVHSAVQDRAMREAERQALGLSAVVVVATDRDLVLTSIMSTRAGQNGELAAHLPTLGTVGVTRAGDAAVARVRQRQTAGTIAVDDGRVYLRPVALPQNLIAVIEVYVPGTSLRAGVGTAVLVLLGEAIVLVGMCMFLADRLAARIVRATRDLARTATSLGAGRLHARVRPSGPREIEEVGAALNLLGDRFLELLAKERALAANLSHRLRVPLTALRLNAEALPAGDDRDRQLRVVDRLEHEISAVISEAGRPLAARPRLHCDLGAVVADRTEFWGALAEDQGRPWHAGPPPEGIVVPAAWSRVTEALDVLLGNVFHHTGEDAACRVTVTRLTGPAAVTDPAGPAAEPAEFTAVTASQPAEFTAVTASQPAEFAAGPASQPAEFAAVTVDDAGPGFADPEAALARGASDADSTGLGLDIAQRLATDTGGTLTITRNEWGGARVVLTLGLVPADTPTATPSRKRRWWRHLAGVHTRP